ncbi:MAG: cupredoxin domain-containing protein [Actinomycetota bacterium]|nr:cupredoxin domain-containing protein [Actinomycetota bacterium]
MRKIFALIALTALFTAGCSSSPKTATEQTESPTPPAATTGPAPVTLTGSVNNHGIKDVTDQAATVSIEIEQDDNYFEPTFIKAAPGASVSVELMNEGGTSHTFTIDSLHVDKTLAPDSKQTVTFNLPSSGVVNFYCKFHKSSGMQGAFYFS